MAVNGPLAVIALSIALGLAVSGMAFGPSLLREMRANRVLANGLTARARIIDLQDTGNRFNDQPEIAISLEVDPPDAPSFRARVIRVLTVADAERYARGRTITVRYDPAHRDHVAIVALAD